MPLLSLLQHAVHDAYREGVGCNLSGGVDSSTIAALTLTINPDTPTFTGYYDSPGFDERRWARMVAYRNHHEILITPQDFEDNWDACVAAFRPPWQGPGMFGQYMVAKHISDNTSVKTVFSGEGGDELFGGYARLLKVAGERLPDGYENYVPPADYPTNVADALDYDWQRLPDLLAVDDAALGAFGLEAVAPFLDPRVVEYALGLPAGRRVGKRTLKRAVRGLVADAILDRTDKMGMPIPLVEWANGPLRDFIGDRLGYLPDPARPFDRRWFHDLIDRTASSVRLAA